MALLVLLWEALFFSPVPEQREYASQMVEVYPALLDSMDLEAVLTRCSQYRSETFNTPKHIFPLSSLMDSVLGTYGRLIRKPFRKGYNAGLRVCTAMWWS